MTIRVLVADDQELVRTGLSMLLPAQPGIEVIGQAVDGTRDEIRAHVREVVEALGSYSGGLIGHGEVAPDIPLENIRTMFEAWREFGTY